MSNFKDDEVEAIADFLRRKGWKVYPPPCTACKGSGFVSKPIDGTAYRDSIGRLISSGGIAQEKCPRGCPPPQMYNGSPMPKSTILDARARSTRTHDL